MKKNTRVFRGVYSVLPDDPDFQLLTPHAKLVFYTARLGRQAGPGSIFRYYPEMLATQTGLTARQIRAALEELAESNWIYTDGPVLWIRNGLRHDPGMRLSDPKHRKAVEATVRELPRVPLVLKFCDYYEIDRPFDAPTMPLGRPSEEEKSEERRVKSEDRTPPTPPQHSEGASESNGSHPLTPETLVKLFNDLTPDETPAVVTLSPERRRKAKGYIAQFPDEAFWRETFAQFHRSRFLRGKAPPREGHKSFKPDFDWLLSIGKDDGVENAVKVHDGRYRD